MITQTATVARMIEHSRRHAHGTFATCPTCHREPLHVTVRGGSTRDGLLTLSGGPGTRHQLVCPCRRSTALHGSLEAAQREWGERMAQQLLPFNAKRRSKHDAA